MFLAARFLSYGLYAVLFTALIAAVNFVTERTLFYWWAHMFI